MKKIAIVLVLGILAFNSYASDLKVKSKVVVTNSSISGTISDKLTGEPLAGVEVKLMDSEVKIYTDFDGKFELKDVKPGAHAILVNYISYQDIVEDIHTESGSTTNVMVKLKSVEK